MLKNEHCVPTRARRPFKIRQVEKLLRGLWGWRAVVVGGERRLKKDFQFKRYADALAFVEQLGRAANREDHHPAILLEWGHVLVQWWTHKVKGLHRNDFIMAAKTDVLYQKSVLRGLSGAH